MKPPHTITDLFMVRDAETGNFSPSFKNHIEGRLFRKSSHARSHVRYLRRQGWLRIPKTLEVVQVSIQITVNRVLPLDTPET